MAFKSSELSKKAQQRAIDEARYDSVEHWDWWEYIYEDAARMAALLGIEIDQHSGKDGTRGPMIWFTGFCSQGDGACFQGTYRPKADAVDAIKAECNDETLISLAERLVVACVTTTLHGDATLHRADVSTTGRYSHSNTMQATYHYDPEYPDNPDTLEDEVIKCLREFADWIYKQLEAEHDYLIGDEAIKERLMDCACVYDEDGAMI